MTKAGECPGREVLFTSEFPSLSQGSRRNTPSQLELRTIEFPRSGPLLLNSVKFARDRAWSKELSPIIFGVELRLFLRQVFEQKSIHPPTRQERLPHGKATELGVGSKPAQEVVGGHTLQVRCDMMSRSSRYLACPDRHSFILTVSLNSQPFEAVGAFGPPPRRVEIVP